MLCDLWERLKQTKKPIVLYGMGNGADKIYAELYRRGIKISGIFATAGFVREKTVYGFRLTDYETLKKTMPEMAVLVCFGSNRPEVFAEIERIAAEQELYFPDVPVYGDNIFDRAFAAANREKLERVYSLLADEKSRQTFENTVMYKLTGDIKYLRECETSPDEPYNTFFTLTDNETYLDLGAYNGDTVLEFLGRVRDYNGIIAVEPNARSFKKLCENTAGTDKITLVNRYVSDSKGLIEISRGKGRGTAPTGGGQLIEADTADNIAEDTKITLLKADVEGEELKMIAGAERIISGDRPKMQIACYHRSEDLWTLPEAVLSLNSSYRLYMRHFPYLPAWDTNFYFVPNAE